MRETDLGTLRRTGAESEDQKRQSDEDGARPDPDPQRIVRHEGPQDQSGALEGPHRADERDEDSENDRDDSHENLGLDGHA